MPSKKAIAGALRERGVFNTMGLLVNGEPAVLYCGQDSFVGGSRWELWVKGRKFKNRAWYEHGSIRFGCNRANRAEVLEQAKAKAKEVCPDTELVPGPWRMTWIPKAAMERAMALIGAEGAKGSVTMEEEQK